MGKTRHLEDAFISISASLHPFDLFACLSYDSQHGPLLETEILAVRD